MAATVDNLIVDIVNLGRETASMSELITKFGNTMKSTLSVDDVIIKDTHSSRDGISSAEEFVLNTGNPYIDNRLSGYSAFVELINYFNIGFRSCLILPITADNKGLGVVSLLSKQENGFDNQTVKVLGLLANLVGSEANAKLEREKSLNVARYFDAAFNTIMPQFLVDKNGMIIKANKSMLSVFNNNAKDLSERNIREFFNIDENGIEILRSGRSMEVSSKLLDNRTFRVTGSKISERMMHILFYDVTELNDLSEKTEFLENSGSETFLLLGKDTKIMWASKNIAKVMRIREDSIIGRRFIDIVKGSENLPEQLGKLTDNIYMVKLKLNPGNDLIVNAQCTFFKNKMGFSCILSNDISRYIISVESRMEELTELSSDAIISIDSMGFIKSINKNAEKLLKFKSEEVIGTSFSTICADNETQNRINQSIPLAKKNGLVTDVFANLVLKNSSETLPCEESILAISDENNETVGYMMIARELATKKLLDILQNDMEEVSKRAEKLKIESDLKTQFIYNISHDLNTPITNIKGYSTLMLEGEFGALTSEQKERLNIIINEAQRLAELIKQILDVAKLESGKVKLDIQQVNFSKLGENPSITSLKESIEGKGLEFKWSVDYNVPEVTADPNRLIQVFVNLIGNAIKFTDKGGIYVKIIKRGKNIRVEVEDTGIGISKEDKVKIFKKFYQLQRRALTTPKGSGTGLGLSIAKEIVNLHNGRMGVVSEVNKGTIFWFTIPISYKAKKKAQQEKPENS